MKRRGRKQKERTDLLSSGGAGRGRVAVPALAVGAGRGDAQPGRVVVQLRRVRVAPTRGPARALLLRVARAQRAAPVVADGITNTVKSIVSAWLYGQ